MAELLKDTIFPCVQCGFCCTGQRMCGYGEYVPEKNQCAFLTADSKCSKYDELVAFEKDSAYPTMGWGCSSPMFNERRDAKLEADPDEFTAIEFQRWLLEIMLPRRAESIVETPAEVEIEIEW